MPGHANILLTLTKSKLTECSKMQQNSMYSLLIFIVKNKIHHEQIEISERLKHDTSYQCFHEYMYKIHSTYNRRDHIVTNVRVCIYCDCVM